ncbi:MAG: hypothetical protein IKJ01_03185 [Lachnospiraceae bacterium]|nr:hypothetical protein [Lachnospiraceae bacterium]
MKQQVKKQIICCFFVVILLIFGMCSGMMKTDSYFSYNFLEQESSVLYSGDVIVKGEDFCTYDMLSRSQSAYLRDDYKRMTIRISFKIILLSFIVAVILQYLFYFKKTIYCYLHQLLGSHKVVVGYIHKQDGEK